MSEEMKVAALSGSARTPVVGAQVAGPLDPATSIEVTIYLRPRTPGAATSGGPFLSREQLAAARGADPSEMSAVEAWARAQGLQIVERDEPARRLRVRGTAAAVGTAFGVHLQRYEHPAGTYRGHSGPVMLPAALSDTVVAVLGLDDRPQARSHLRHAESNPAVSYSPVAVADAYGAGEGSTAAGVCVAIVELGGGFAPADLGEYFKALGRATPSVEAVSVDGGTNAPTGATSGPDTEVMLDIEVVGAVAPGATIAVYFAPNTDQGFADAISAAVHDTTHKPQLISISWGGPENTYTAQAIAAFEAAFNDAAMVGTTVFVAAGDNGSSDGVTDGLAHVDYPASSPQVVGCGGTHLQLATGGGIVSETVWDDLPKGGATGGGVSSTFALPSWQGGVGVPESVNPGGKSGRGVPDVAADADPDTGYQIRVDGTDTVVGGTSAVAPLYAALAARAVAHAGSPLGFVNPTLYQLGDAAFRDITVGNNGGYQAKMGWDACTGLGSPIAAGLISGLAASKATPGALQGQ